MKKVYYYDTTYGKMGIAENGQGITNVFFGNTVHPKDFDIRETPLLIKASLQLMEYLSGKRRIFELPLAPEGTDFEQTVWSALLTIPFGETRSYGQIARQIGKPGASRAVGRANGLNPISIFIPCHRVIGASGRLTGYAGGLDMKQRLLTLEGCFRTSVKGV